jgi:uncharacterized protein (TIGR02145 family)
MKISLLLISGLAICMSFACTKEEKTGPEFGSVKDIDGNRYKTIIIGTQTWMAENLKTTHYRNGQEIANTTDSAEWSESTTGAYCNYDNNPANAEIYGRLYNFFAVADSRLIAPDGWHVSTKSEWETLITHLGGTPLAAPKIRMEGEYYWWAFGTSNNESGFSAVGAGARIDVFRELKGHALWWTSNEYTEAGGEYAFVEALSSHLLIASGYKKLGCSIRCVKD